MKGKGMFAEVGSLGPGFSLFQCHHHVVTIEAEQCCEGRVGWEWMRLLNLLSLHLWVVA